MGSWPGIFAGGEVEGVSEFLLGASLRLWLDPDVEVNALAVDDVFTLADFGLRDDPVTKHGVSLERNLERELNSHASVREVKTGVVAASHQKSSSTAVRRG
jgi:hypothetical protein